MTERSTEEIAQTLDDFYDADHLTPDEELRLLRDAAARLRALDALVRTLERSIVLALQSWE